MSDFPLSLFLPVVIPAAIIVIGCLVAFIVGPIIDRWWDSRK